MIPDVKRENVGIGRRWRSYLPKRRLCEACEITLRVGAGVDRQWDKTGGTGDVPTHCNRGVPTVPPRAEALVR